jgi:hypothetical protein
VRSPPSPLLDPVVLTDILHALNARVREPMQDIHLMQAGVDRQPGRSVVEPGQ